MSRQPYPRRYLFDLDFAAPPPAPEPPAPPPPEEPVLPVAAHEALLAQADAAAFERGMAEGLRRAAAADAARLAAASERLGTLLAGLVAGLDAHAARAAREAAELGCLFARRLAGAALERQPLAPIEALARQTLVHLRAAPHVVVRVAETLVPDIKPRLDAIAAEAGFAGKLVLLGEPGMAPGDARLDWADGGASREREGVERLMDGLIAWHLDGGPAGPESPGDRA